MSRATVSFETVGCRLNQYESDALERVFVDRGYTVVPFHRPADVCVINTCTVTGRSDHRSRQMVRRACRTNPDATVVVTGCYAQNHPAALASIPGVGLVVGNAAKMRLPDLVSGANGRATVVLDPLPEIFQESPASRGRMGGRTRAFLKVQDGCDMSCAYCAVRIARGRSRSRTWAAVQAEARGALEAGYREIVLTGVNLGSYGRDLGDSADLTGLVGRLAALPGVARVRLSSVEPQEVTEDLIEMVASHPKVCRHFHLPLQSGSEPVLRRMNRSYDPDHYTSLVRSLADRIPDCGIGADVMVGFPGETETDFRRTRTLLESLPLTYLHVFSYSPRPNTAAAEMGPPVPAHVRRARSQALRDLGKDKNRRFRNRAAGQTLEVLFETEAAPGRLVGLTDNYIRVEADGTCEDRNRVFRVRIDRVTEARTAGCVEAEVHRKAVLTRPEVCEEAKG